MIKEFNIDLYLLIKAIDQTGIGVVISNPRLEGNPLIYVNKGFEEITGYASEDVIGKNCRFLQGDKKDQLGLELLRKAIRERTTCEVEIVNYRKNGEEFWNELQITPLFDADGQLEYFIGIQKDVTIRKKAQETLVLFEKVFQNTMQGVIITDAYSNILLVNEAFTQITGYTLEEAQGKNPNILNSGKQNYTFYSNLWKEILFKGQWEGELWNKRKDGEIYPEFLNISAVRDNDGKVTNYVAIFTDITESKHRENQLAKLSVQDALTGIANRRKFDNFLLEKWLILTDIQEPISLILLDLDFFKLYNDRYGHQEGDYCLMQIAKTIEMSVYNKSYLVARYGGEEFAVVLPQCDAKIAREIAEKIRVDIERAAIPHEDSKIAAHVTTSCGVATMIPKSDLEPATLINQADQALYRAKNNGRNRVEMF